MNTEPEKAISVMTAALREISQKDLDHPNFAEWAQAVAHRALEELGLNPPVATSLNLPTR